MLTLGRHVVFDGKFGEGFALARDAVRCFGGAGCRGRGWS